MNDMWRPHCFRTDNGREFTNRSYVEFGDSAGIRREYAAPGKLQQNPSVKNEIYLANHEGWSCGRLRDSADFSGVDLARIPNLGANGNRLWVEAVLWVAD